MRIVVFQLNAHATRIQVDRTHLRLDEIGPSQHLPDRADGMPRLQHARAGLEQQRGHREEVVAADKRDRYSIALVLPQALKMRRGVKAPEPASEDDDARWRLCLGH